MRARGARGRGVCARGRGVGARGREGGGSNRNPGKRLAERDAGITEYVKLDIKGFDGIIKARYADFQVSEVDVHGSVAKLTDLTVPVAAHAGKDASADDHAELLKELLTAVVWNKLLELDQSSDSDADAEVKVDVTSMSKDSRTKVYNAISNTFGSRIMGNTITEQNEKFIIFSKFSKTSRKDTRIKWKYPEEFVHFIVYKENLDTMETAQIIAKGLHLHHIKPSFFGYSGTKDRRAKTSQWFSIKKIDPQRIAGCVKHLKNIYVGNFQFKNYHLSLGCLKGNVFRIALRNIIEDLGTIDKAIESLKENGFLNYYGLQRFGSRADVPTYKIGHHLLRGEFREAIDLILTPHGPFETQLKHYHETQNASQALTLFPKSAKTVECKLLLGLSKSAKNDFVTILEYLPRNMRLLYLHSFQSWIWNQCVSERIKRYGLHLVVGDLINENVNLDSSTLQDADDSDVHQWDSFENSNNKEEMIEDSNEQDKCDVNEQDAGSENLQKCSKADNTNVKEVTEEDLNSNKYNIYNLVLPLPGHNVVYPSNMKDFYQIISAKEGVDLNCKQKVRSYNVSGAYRRVIVKPLNVLWKHVYYDDPFCDLIPSDLDELKQNINIKHSQSTGKYRALIVEFMLGSSSYATMALRELLKRDTSTENQAQNNDYHKGERSEVTIPLNTNDSNYQGKKRNIDSDSSGEKRFKEQELPDT